jgi:2-polyprenyl-6-hydroxyphenyl methylase/3-demethylubiquinone-9 3-methyltransferase
VIGMPVLSVGRRVRLRHVLHALEPLLVSGKCILDAGCSDGRLAGDVATAHRDCQVVAVDIDEGGLAAARARADRLQNMRVKHVAIGNSEPVGEFDVVVCTDVLEHIADERAAFAWLARNLRPGGDLLLHVPAAPQEHPLEAVREALAAEVAQGLGPHLRLGYSPERLRELASAAGLMVIDVAWTFHHPLTRLAADLDTWTFLHGARPAKLALLPFLLGAGALERAPSRARRGNGVLLHARASG